MKAKDLKKIVNDIPDDAEIVLAKPFVIDDEELTAVLDIPIVGIAFREPDDESDENELRFLLSLENVKSVFKPEEILWMND